MITLFNTNVSHTCYVLSFTELVFSCLLRPSDVNLRTGDSKTGWYYHYVRSTGRGAVFNVQIMILKSACGPKLAKIIAVFHPPPNHHSVDMKEIPSPSETSDQTLSYTA